MFQISDQLQDPTNREFINDLVGAVGITPFKFIMYVHIFIIDRHYSLLELSREPTSQNRVLLTNYGSLSCESVVGLI